MKVYFATKNRHKVAEVRAVMAEFGIVLEQLEFEKEEDKEKSIEEVALFNAEKFSTKTNLPVVVEDTGFYYNSYPNFPGSNPKLMFTLLGYRGLLKLLEGVEDRGAEFRSAVAYYYKGEKKLFVGRLTGKITTEALGLDKDVMPYERIFVADEDETGKIIGLMPRENKNKISHRSKAFSQLARWLKEKETKANNTKSGDED